MKLFVVTQRPDPRKRGYEQYSTAIAVVEAETKTKAIMAAQKLRPDIFSPWGEGTPFTSPKAEELQVPHFITT